MKKLAAILLLAILLFNWVGYRFVISYLEHSSDRVMEARLDEGDYNDADLVEVKVPISLPYQVNWSNFERFSGQIEIDGVHYKYVKRKVHNDSLVLMCLPNPQKTEMQDAKSRFFALVNDLNNTDNDSKTHKKQSANSKNLSVEFFFPSGDACTATSAALLQSPSSSHSPRLLSSTILAPERPPAGA